MTVQTENERNEENLLDGFPRISSYNNCIINNEDEFSLVRDDDAPRGSVRIETGDTVWSMAFGSCVSKDDNKLWRRFRAKSDVILATGLSNGKIKLWGVRCGKLVNHAFNPFVRNGLAHHYHLGGSIFIFIGTRRDFKY